MKTLATCSGPTADRRTKLPSPLRPLRDSGVEPLEARIAPATLAALPGNSSFEDPTDFALWTVNTGPASAFTEYLTANVTTSVVRDALAPEGDAYALLSFQGRVAPTTTGFGPSLQSETFTATAGEQISVVWRATNDGDTAHPRGRLFTADGTPVGTFFDSDTGTTPFTTSSVTVPTAGQYYLLFEAGASDVSVGGIVGAKLEIDAVHRNPDGITVNTLMTGQLSVDVSGEIPLSNNPNTFLITLDQTGEYVNIFVNGSLDLTQPLALIDRINVLGLGGSDQLTVDSTNGLIAVADGIHFDGGGGVDTLRFAQAGGATRISDTFNVGPNPGAGSSTISGGVSSQVVSFLNTEPVLNNVPATTLTINGTSAGNMISSAVGAGGGIFTGTTGKITVDAFSSIEFNGKTSLVINGLGGNDAFTINNPSAAAGLTSVTVQGGDPAVSPGDTLSYLTAGAINPSAVGMGTITATGLPTVNFTGMEVTTVAGLTTAAGATGLIVTATGDQASSGKEDAFLITANATTQFLTLALNGTIGLYAHQAAIEKINAVGLGGADSVTLTGTGNAEAFNFIPTAADAGATSITGVVTVGYSTIESVILNGLGGNDTFALGGALGTVQVIGGSGSDRVNFSTAASRVVFDLDAVGVDQYVNASGQLVKLGDVIENFTGSSFNDTLRANAANFVRDLQGGANTNETFPPGDELSFDGQQQVVQTTLVNSNTGTYQTNGFADVTFEGFDTPLIANSPSGPGFGTPGNSNAFDTAIVYDLLKSTSGGKVTPGRTPTAVATGDLNNDGFIDIVVVNSSTSTLSVMLNAGDGTFGTPVSIKSGGRAPQDIVIGNFDTTPGLDLAVTNRASGNLAVFSGNNLGGFAAPTVIKTAPSPLAIAVGRVDGDLIDDIVLTHATNKISILIGTGTSFAPGLVAKTLGSRPVDVVIGDFNADGKADVATSNLYSHNMSYFQGDGLGGLAVPTIIATGKRPTGLVAADFNLDGVLDLAVSHQVSLFVGVFFSNGATPGVPQFQPQLQVALPGKHSPTAIVAADFNGDGLVDLGLGNSVGTKFTVLISGNLGKFSQPYEFDLGKFRGSPRTGALAVADLSNDGLLDVIATGRNSADARVILRKI